MKSKWLAAILVLGIMAGLYLFLSSGRVGPKTEEQAKSVTEEAPAQALPSEVEKPDLPLKIEPNQALKVESVSGDELTVFVKKHRTTYVEQISADLNSLLADKGFTQEETDLVVKRLAKAWLESNDSIDVAGAINKTAEELGLDAKRKATLDDAVMVAITNTTGKVSFAELQGCMAIRLSRASTCAQEIGQELISTIGSKAEGDVLGWQVLNSLAPAHEAAVKKAVESCHEPQEKAHLYYDVGLKGCI